MADIALRTASNDRTQAGRSINLSRSLNNLHVLLALLAGQEVASACVLY